MNKIVQQCNYSYSASCNQEQENIILKKILLHDVAVNYILLIFVLNRLKWI